MEVCWKNNYFMKILGKYLKSVEFIARTLYIKKEQ